MSWFAAIGPFFLALAAISLPGLPVAASLGARGISFVALSIAGSVSAIASAAVIAPLIGLTWQPYTPFIVSIPIAIVGFLLRWWWLRRLRTPRPAGEWGRVFLAAIIAVAAGGLLIALPLKAGIGMPNWLPQTPDISFHLNAVRQILDTGNASSFALNLALPNSTVVYYPAAWHAIVALVTQLSGAQIVVSANVTTFAIACVIWPVGCVFLARQLFGAQKLPLVLTGVLSAAFAVFPLMIVEYGVLYPYLLGVALMPIAIGLLVLAIGKARSPDLETPGRWVMFCWIIIGVGFAHPSAALAVMAFAVPLVAQVVIEYLIRLRGRHQLRTRGTLAIAGYVVGLVLGAYIWLKLGAVPGANKTYPYQTISQAFGEALTNGTLERPAAIVASVLMIAGIVIALRRKSHLWLIASYLISIGLFMMVTGWYPGRLRSAVVGIWYNNTPRLAALLPLFAIPLTALGATSAIRWVQNKCSGVDIRTRLRWLSRPHTLTAVAVVGTLILVPLTHGMSIAAMETTVANTYRMSDDSALLSPDEVAMFKVVENVTPRTAVIAGNPWNGSGLVYAYSDRKALFPHVHGSWSAERWDIAEAFTSATPAVCKAIKDFGVTYVLDFGNRYLTPRNPGTAKYPGFDDLAQSNDVTLVAQRGNAKLYKVTACGLG